MARDFSAELFGTPEKEVPVGRDFSADLFGAPKVAPTEVAAEPVVTPEGVIPVETPTEGEGSKVLDFLGRVAKNVPESMNIGAAGAFQALSEQASQLYQRTLGGRFVQALTGTIGEKDPFAIAAEESARLGAESKARIEARKPTEDQGILLSGVESGLESFGQNMALLPLALLPGGQPAVLAAFGTITGGQAYQEAREKGLSPQQALPYAASQGAIEIATEYFPLGELVKDVNKKTGFGRMLWNQIIREVPGEQAATILQDMNEWAVLNPDKPFSEYIKERPNAAAQTLIATIVGSGGNVVVAKGMEKIADKLAQTEEGKKVNALIADLDKIAADETLTEQERQSKKRETIAADFQDIYGREATNDELDLFTRQYDQRALAETVAGPDATGRIEPSISVPDESVGETGVAAEPTETQAAGVGVPGILTERPGGRAETKLTPLGAVFQPRDDVSAQQKRTNIHYNTLMTQPDNPVTQSLTALDAAIQKAKDAYADIATRLNIPSSEDMMGLGVRLPAPIGELFKYPSASGSAVRLVTASKDLTSGAKRGSPQKVESARRDVNSEANRVDQIIEAALAAAEDPAVKAQIDKLNEQLAVNKGVAARQAEIAALPIEQRAAKIKEIEDEVRAGLKPTEAEAAPTPPTPPAPTAPTVAVPDAAAIEENPDAYYTKSIGAAKQDLEDGYTDIYYVDGNKNVTPITSPEQLDEVNILETGGNFWSVPKAEEDPSGRILGMITQAVGPSLDATMATLLKSRKAAFNRLRKLFADGKINAQQFTESAIKILDAIDDQQMRDFNKSQRVQRGPDIVRQKILDAVRRGKISRETAEFALWLVNNNPQVANDLAIKINLPKDKRAQAVSDGTAGYYVSASKLIRAILHRDPDTGQYYDTKPEVLVHEILHHMERMLPAPLRKLIRKEWERQLIRAAKEADRTNDQNLKDYMALLMEAYATGNEAAEKLANQYIVEGKVPRSYYALTNPSEFWAVNGSNILYGRYKADSAFAKIGQWMREFIEALKNIFGFDNNHAIIKGLNDVLKGDGTFVSRFILAEGTTKAPMVTPFEAGEKKLLEMAEKGIGKIKGPVLEALVKNDITGALRALSAQTKGFYSDLAARLADLNLPTTIVLNDVRALIRRQLNEKIGFSEHRLFDYMQRTYPAAYDKYFKNYDRQENLEKVFEGLKAIKDKYDLKPVIGEYEATINEYNKIMKGLAVPGAYFPMFDAISLDTDNATYDTLLHEVLHAATEAILEADPSTLTPGQREAVEALEDMFDYAKAQVPLQLYGFTDIHEFVSELFTNKAFRERLQKIQYKPAKQPLLTQIARAIYKLFGIDNLAGNAMAQATQLFSAVRTKKPISIGPRFAGQPKRDPKKGPATGNWRAQEDYGNGLINMIQQMNKDGVPWSKISKDVGKALFRAQYSGLRRIVLPGLGLRHLSDLTKWAFPQLQGAVRTVEKMLADRNRHMTEGAKILREWLQLQRKNANMERLMSRVMVEATLRGVDPATASSTDLPPTDALARAWAMLPNEYKAMYKKVQQYYIKMLKETLDTMKQRVRDSGKPAAEKQELLDEIDRQFGIGNLVHPYFPLRRFGKFWFQVGSGKFKEFVEFESESARNLAMERTRERLIRNGRKDLAATIEAGNGMSELYSRNMASTKIFQDIAKIVDNISASSVTDAKDQIKDALDQLLYVMLPQNSMRKMFINRQGIQGASADMLRVFATTSVHSAYQLSRFKFAEEFRANLTGAIEYVRDKYKGSLTGAAYRDFILEVENRDKQIMSNEDTSIAAVLSGKASQAAYFYMLTAPVTALVNLLGFPQLVLSTLGGDYGFKKTGRIAMDHMIQYLRSSGSRTIVPLAKGQFLQAKFPSLFESGYLSPELQKAADVFMEENDVNISQTSDIMGLSDRPSELYTGRWDTTKRVISEPFHQSERLMREIGLITAFELAYEKLQAEPKRTQEGYVQRDAAGNPMMRNQQEAFEDAIQEARDKIGLTLGDFNRPMKPRYLSMPGISVLMIFKTFAIYATYAVLRNSQVTMFGPLSKSERNEIEQKLQEQLATDPNKDQLVAQRMAEIDEYLKVNKKESLRRILGITGTSFLLGGLAATPFFSVLMPVIANMFGDADDDEFFDWEAWFRNWCQETLGGYAANLLKDMGASEKTAEKYGKDIGMSVARGPVGTFAGVSLSDRVSLDLKNLWIRDPRYTPDARQDVIETAVANAGPFAGLVLNHVDAYKLFNEGHYHRAFEKALPAFISKPLTAERLAREGATTKQGIPQISEFSSFEIAMQAVGLQPERLALLQKKSIAEKQYEQKILAKRDAIMDRLWLEYRTDNEDGYERAMVERDKFNDMYPEKRISQKQIKESFEKRRKDAAAAEDFGTNIDKKLRGRIEEKFGPQSKE